jgi:hypothetical protein
VVREARERAGFRVHRRPGFRWSARSVPIRAGLLTGFRRASAPSSRRLISSPLRFAAAARALQSPTTAQRCGRGVGGSVRHQCDHPDRHGDEHGARQRQHRERWRVWRLGARPQRSVGRRRGLRGRNHPSRSHGRQGGRHRRPRRSRRGGAGTGSTLVHDTATRPRRQDQSRTNAMLSPVNVPGTPTALAIGYGSVWVADPHLAPSYDSHQNRGPTLAQASHPYTRTRPRCRSLNGETARRRS